MNHPLRHIFTDTTLGDADTRATEVPEVTQSALRASQYIVIRGMRNRAIDDCLDSDFFEFWRHFKTSFEEWHQAIDIGLEQFAVKSPVHAIERPGFGTPHFVGAYQESEAFLTDIGRAVRITTHG